MAEPLPFVREGVLYWKVAVIPEDAAGIAYQAFVDSRTNEVVELEGDREIALFVAGQIPPGEKDLIPEEQELIDFIKEKIRELEKLVHDLEERIR